MSCDIECVEVVVRIVDEFTIQSFYGPVLYLLGFSQVKRGPGLTIWRSDSRKTSVVFVETASQSCCPSASCSVEARYLRFATDSEHQLDELCVLLRRIGARILVDRPRYAADENEAGVVFSADGNTIFEVKCSESSTFE